MGENMLKRCLVPVLVLAMPIAALVGCSSNQGFNDNNDCDYMVVPEAQGTLPSTTNRCEDGSLSVGMNIDVRFLSHEGAGSTFQSTDLALFRLKFYDVTYRNLNTNGTVAGVDVPTPFRESIESVVDDGGTVTLTGFPVVEAGAKLVAPLNQAGFYTSPAGVPMVATLTFWGYPLQNPDAWCFGQMDWYFTVFSDGC
jgi:hypothetical protein